MIEILTPGVDDLRIAELRTPSAGVRQVDGWLHALAELAGIEHPELDARGHERYLATNWTAARIESESRYILFPWRNSLVRLPSSEIFHRLRTARNRFLVDDEEQRSWSDTTVAVAGLSVGSSVSTTSVLSGARTLRLADRDTLAPTNLNRLRSSVCDIGEHKVTIATRTALELDPYADITGFLDGYHPDMAGEFLAPPDSGLLVLVEEMDDVAMKVHIRIRARALGIPVVMVTDNGDNVMIDIERFDLDRSYPLFHGRAGDVTELSGEELADPANRLRLVSDVVGSEVTPRARYSLTQVGRTLPSWPQMGTAATAAGAVGALAARYVACGKALESGRYRLDLDRTLLGEDAVAANSWNELDESSFLELLNAI